MLFRRGLPALALAAVVCSAGPAFAADAHPRAVLDVVRRSGAESCPDRTELESRVAGHLGYQPFVEQADLHAEVVIERTPRGLEAEMRLTQAGKEQGRRVLDSPSTDCSDLGSALALALSIAIDPVSAQKPPEPAAPPPAPEPAPEPVAAPPTAPPERDRGVTLEPAPARARPGPALHAQLGAGALESFGTAPATATGLDVYAGAIAGHWSLGLEGRADLPASQSVAQGQVQSSLLLVTLLPCFHHSGWFGCLSGSAGALAGTGSDIAKPEKQTTFYGSAGARSGLEIPVSKNVELAVFGGLGATLTRTTLTLADREVWTTPTLNGFLGSNLVVTFADGNRRLSAIR